MSSLLKNLIIALVITVLLGVVYYFTIGSSTDDEFGADTTPDSSVALRTQKILADTQRINEYALDISIFDDQRFRGLQDFGISIPDVQTGRSNPFAPVQ